MTTTDPPPLDAAYRRPNTARWLWCAARAARRARAPLWPVLSASWAGAFPATTPHPEHGMAWWYNLGDTSLRAFLAAHLAYADAHGARAAGHLARVRAHLRLSQADALTLELLIEEAHRR